MVLTSALERAQNLDEVVRQRPRGDTVKTQNELEQVDGIPLVQSNEVATVDDAESSWRPVPNTVIPEEKTGWAKQKQIMLDRKKYEAYEAHTVRLTH